MNSLHLIELSITCVVTKTDTTFDRLTSNLTAPRTCTCCYIRKGEDIEVASIAFTATDNDGTVGQLLYLGLITAIHAATTKKVPCLTEVIGVDHIVVVRSTCLILTNLANQKCCIDTIIVASLCLEHARLKYTTGTIEQTVCLGKYWFVVIRILVVVKRSHIHEVCSYVLRFIPSDTTVMTAQTSRVVVVCGIATREVLLTAHTHNEHLVALAVCHDSSITECIVEYICVSNVIYSYMLTCTISNELFIAPCLTIVGRTTELDVYWSKAHVGTTRTVVGNSKNSALSSYCNSRDTVGFVHNGIVRIEQVLVLVGLVHAI